ncbi:MAG: TadE/TadG family type IV pilus assembly protein [Rhodomicrobium sp.]
MHEFLRDRRGSILLETAIVLPVLVLILLGLAEFGEAFSIKRRNSQVASTAADLVAQVSSVATSDLQDIASIGGTILAPFPSPPLGLRISSVIQNAKNATVQWSYGSGSLSAAAKGSAYALPTGLINQNQTIIVAQTSYKFAPTFGTYLLGGVTFTSTAYNTPRIGGAVACAGC